MTEKNDNARRMNYEKFDDWCQSNGLNPKSARLTLRKQGVYCAKIGNVLYVQPEEATQALNKHLSESVARKTNKGARLKKKRLIDKEAARTLVHPPTDHVQSVAEDVTQPSHDSTE